MNDLVLSVRQLAQYPDAGGVLTSDVFLLQRGLGGPYLTTSALGLINNMLAAQQSFSTGNITAASLTLPNTSTLRWDGVASLMGSMGGFSFGVGSKTVASIMPTGDLFLPGQVTVGRDPTAGCELATYNWVMALRASSVTSFNGRFGNIVLGLGDIVCAGGAPITSPLFFGYPRAPTEPDPTNCSDLIATTAFVQHAICHDIEQLLTVQPFVNTFNSRTGNVMLQLVDITNAGGAPIDSPFFLGVPQAPTAAPGDASPRLATTAFVTAADIAVKQSVLDQMDENSQELNDFLQQNYAPLASPQFTGIPSGPTAAPGTSTGQIATTAFVMNAVSASVTGVSSFNTRTGAVTLSGADITSAGGALLVSPVFTGTPHAPTAAPGTSTLQLATTAFVAAAISSMSAVVSSFNTRTGAVTLSLADITAAGGAPLNNAALTGTPTAPSPAVGDSSTSIATTAWVLGEIGAISSGVVSFNGRSGPVTFLASDLSSVGGALLASPALTGLPTAPTATAGSSSTQLATTAFVSNAVSGLSFAPLNSPAFTGIPSAPTASPGTNSTQLATTAFVTGALAAQSHVVSFNTRTGAVTLTLADVTTVGAAPLASPALTGNPTAPTQTTGTSNTTLATTAFVQSAVSLIGGVSTFNGRSGAVTLAANDVSAVGGALLASPSFTGIPVAPTATAGTNNTQIATTAFVAAAVAAGVGVSTFNGRTGAVTLAGSDISAAGGALLAGPVFTGMPQAPTAPGGTNTTQIATTAFVTGAIAAGNFATVAQLAGYLPLSGGTVNPGPIRVIGGQVQATGGFQPTNASGASVGMLLYVDNATGNRFLTWASGWYDGLDVTNNNRLIASPSGGVLNIAANGNTTVSGGLTTGGDINLGGNLYVPSGHSVVPIVNNSSWCGLAGNAWAGVAAYSFAQQSDPRLKREISVMTKGALERVLKTPVVRFKWRDHKEKGQWSIGWNAEDVLSNTKEYSTVIVGTDKSKTLALDTTQMVAWLWEAVQELTARVAALESA